MSLAEGPSPAGPAASPAARLAASPAARRRSTRDRPAKSPLSEDAIVDAALAILTSEGPEAVTMRRVAAALDTGPASLYVYVPGREGLLQAMLDRVIAAVGLEVPDPARWRDQLQSLLKRLRRALRAYPGIAAMTLADSPTTEPILLLTENLLGILLAGGLDRQDAAWACDVLVLLVTASAREDDVRHRRSGGDGSEGSDGEGSDGVAGRSEQAGRNEQAGRIYQTFAALPPGRFPLLSAHAGPMVAGDGDERFGFAIDVVLDGLLARAARR